MDAGFAKEIPKEISSQNYVKTCTICCFKIILIWVTHKSILMHNLSIWLIFFILIQLYIILSLIILIKTI